MSNQDIGLKLGSSFCFPGNLTEKYIAKKLSAIVAGTMGTCPLKNIAMINVYTLEL